MFKKKCEKLPQPFLIVKYRITDSKYIPGSNESEGNKLFTASRDSREKAMVCSTNKDPGCRHHYLEEHLSRWACKCNVGEILPVCLQFPLQHCEHVFNVHRSFEDPTARSKVLAVYQLRHEHYTSWWPLLPWRTSSKSVIPSFKNKAFLPFQATLSLLVIT